MAAALGALEIVKNFNLIHLPFATIELCGIYET